MRLLFFSSSVARPPIQVLPATTRPVERPVRLWPRQAPPKAMLMNADRNRLDLYGGVAAVEAAVTVDEAGSREGATDIIPRPQQVLSRHTPLMQLLETVEMGKHT